MKAGTATKMILNIISTTTMIKLNKTYKNFMVDLKISNNKLTNRAINIVSQVTDLNKNESKNLIKKANGHVKNAILMHLKNKNYIESCKILKKNNGSLRKSIEQ
tara:strand:- start:348 stop:659 length:312 start_codon:yes stop_codon:yes gene_type:complete